MEFKQSDSHDSLAEETLESIVEKEVKPQIEVTVPISDVIFDNFDLVEFNLLDSRMKKAIENILEGKVPCFAEGVEYNPDNIQNIFDVMESEHSNQMDSPVEETIEHILHDDCIPVYDSLIEENEKVTSREDTPKDKEEEAQSLQDCSVEEKEEVLLSLHYCQIVDQEKVLSLPNFPREETPEHIPKEEVLSLQNSIIIENTVDYVSEEEAICSQAVPTPSSQPLSTLPSLADFTPGFAEQQHYTKLSESLNRPLDVCEMGLESDHSMSSDANNETLASGAKGTPHSSVQEKSDSQHSHLVAQCFIVNTLVDNTENVLKICHTAGRTLQENLGPDVPEQEVGVSFNYLSSIDMSLDLPAHQLC